MRREVWRGWWKRASSTAAGRVAVPTVVVALAYVVPGASPIRADDSVRGLHPSLPRVTTLQESIADLEELATTASAAVVTIDVGIGDDSRQGSGFIVDPSGLIVTNHHVVRGATSVRVRLASGDVYEHVALLAQDERRDIAVLKIPGFGLPALELGDSGSVRVGSPAIAIGSPLGLENTVSTGIVSGRRREPEGYQLLQITAPASSGSSGGPVLSRDGRVIGIAVSQMRQGQNVNFAVPINYARGMLEASGREALAEFSPASAEPVREATDLSAGTERVNRGLRYDLSALDEGHQVTFEARDLSGGLRTTRISVRRLRDVSGRQTRFERFLESETSVRRGVLGPSVTTRRERRRTIVSEDDLRPVSARGQVEWRVSEEWRRASYDLQFDEGRVVGTIQDSTGVVTQVDREIPEGILIRDMRDVAFGAIVADPLVGRSIEFVTFDPYTGQVTTDRFDVRWRTTISIGGEDREALVVDVASGLTNERVHFTSEVPRTVLRRVSDRDDVVEEVVRLHRIPPPGAERF